MKLVTKIGQCNLCGVDLVISIIRSTQQNAWRQPCALSRKLAGIRLCHAYVKPMLHHSVTLLSELDSLIKKTGEEPLDLANSSGLRMAASTKPNGEPHVSITDLTVVDGRFHIGVDPATYRVKNLKHNTSIAII